MYKWLAILSVIIVVALCGMGWLGYRSIQMWAQGIEGTRIGEFAEVAEQIREDVKRKLDAFIEQEQARPYSEYQYYYVPDNVVATQQQTAVLRSPLAGRLEHGLAYYNFQIQPDGSVTTPNVDMQERQSELATGSDEQLYVEAVLNTRNIEDNLLPLLRDVATDSSELDFKQNVELPRMISSKTSTGAHLAEEQEPAKKESSKGAQFRADRTQQYPIESLQSPDDKVQIVRQSRGLIASNEAQIQEFIGRDADVEQRRLQDQPQQVGLQEELGHESVQAGEYAQQLRQIEGFAQQPAASQPQEIQAGQTSEAASRQRLLAEESQADMVEIEIEPFAPVVVPSKNAEQSVFGGQVFMLRRVQIEDRQFLQGFQLNEDRLLEEVKESAQRLKRDWMSFELAQTQSEQSAYTAILDFVGLGRLVLNLTETDPAWTGRQIRHLQNWYFGIMSIVLCAVALGLASLWRNARAQIKLAQKKDDFISAVSHELRTPLTSIRMYSEMLEKNWVKSEDKIGEYYRNMRQESERLSRLIENVLDFSRIQRGRKRYSFDLGDMNKCVTDVVEVMRPYAAQRGFSIRTELGRLRQCAFDRDAVTQIVVNLLDNAVKYARDAQDKTITVRTRIDERFVLIEVEDHGPGVPHRQREKIFEEFYRSGAEATRETAGTGLGLALVKRFAQAHNGFVEIISAKPTGAVFRVALAAKM